MDIKTLIFFAILVTEYVTCQDVDVLSRFYTNTDDIYKGMNITFTCQVTQSYLAADTLLIFRTIYTGYMPLANNNGLLLNPPANVEYLGFSNNALSVQITNVQILDSGDYGCAATRKTPEGGTQSLGREDFTINVKTPIPPKGKPICATISNHSNLILQEGDSLQISCQSDAGQPQIVLQWSSSGIITLPDSVIFESEESTILSSLTVVIDNTFDGIQFICKRQSDLFPTSDDSCSLGPFMLQDTTIGTTNATLTPEESSDQTVIIAVTLTVIIILLICALIIGFLIKSGKCPLYISNKTNNKTKPRTSENTPIEMTSIHEGRNTHVESHDNPLPVEHFVANGGAEYALINKKNTPQSNEDNSKYPTPPNYPRPPKSAETDEGEQYANSSVVTSPKGMRNKKNTKQASTEEPAYGNTGVANNLRQSAPPGLQDQNGWPLYANSSDVTLSRRSAPSDINDSMSELNGKQLYANAPVPIDGERVPPSFEQEAHSEGPMYADVSTSKNGMPHSAVSKTNSIHHPAPDVSPPPPPEVGIASNADQDSGLAYADLDLSNGPLTIADGVSQPANRDSVVYASIA